jgi:glycogen debranching enzyme
MTSTDIKKTIEIDESLEYVVDSRPLCQGMPFVLTDAAHPRLVLKQGSHFLVLDQSAYIPACNTLGYGYYRMDTRYVSEWELTINDVQLSLLSSDVEKGYCANLLYTNPQTGNIPQQKLTVERKIVLDDLLWEELSFENYSKEAHDIELKIKFQSDFADMFEVRGLNRPIRGERMVPVASHDRRKIFLAYRGLDNELLETEIEIFGLVPDKIADGIATFKIHLPVRKVIKLEMAIATKEGGILIGGNDSKIGFRAAYESAEKKFKEWKSHGALIETGHEIVNLALDRGLRDIYILRQPTPKGYGISAGIPWYCAVFGRDSAITGLQVIPFFPELAKESIEVLAAYQGQKRDDYKAEEPGRIMHEVRFGELARTKQIPHSPYYGTIDATQLWLMLFCEYIKWSGDLEFAKQLWPAVKLALSWFDKCLEKGNGFLTYKRVSEHGLENQGWKDSGDSVMYVDGTLAKPPIAICEAQGYLYAAYTGLVEIAELLEQKRLANKLRADAIKLKEAFQREFWMPDEKYIALALDGDGKQVGVISSNPGHCLWTGILDGDKAQAVADRLMNIEMQSGWGIRTLSSNTVAYNPMSYHNGTIWPHDNAIIGEGMRKIGRTSDVEKVMQAILEVAQSQPDYRLPELFCGFDRIDTRKPTDYPVSCSPQAWAAGSMFQLIKACLNFRPDAVNNCLRIVEPNLPEWLGTVIIRKLRVGKGVVDLAFSNQNGSTYCQILNKSGNIRVILEG